MITTPSIMPRFGAATPSEQKPPRKVTADQLRQLAHEEAVRRHDQAGVPLWHEARDPVNVELNAGGIHRQMLDSEEFEIIG